MENETEQFDLRSNQFKNELWLLVDKYSDLHGPQMARIFQEFANHSKTSLDDLPGDDFDEDKVSSDNEVSSLEDKMRAQHDD